MASVDALGCCACGRGYFYIWALHKLMNLYFRGSVNRWECDENDHLNVRFFVEKHWQSLCAAARLSAYRRL